MKRDDLGWLLRRDLPCGCCSELLDGFMERVAVVRTDAIANLVDDGKRARFRVTVRHD